VDGRALMVDCEPGPPQARQARRERRAPYGTALLLLQPGHPNRQPGEPLQPEDAPQVVPQSAADADPCRRPTPPPVRLHPLPPVGPGAARALSRRLTRGNLGELG